MKEYRFISIRTLLHCHFTSFFSNFEPNPPLGANKRTLKAVGFDLFGSPNDLKLKLVAAYGDTFLQPAPNCKLHSAAGG